MVYEIKTKDNKQDARTIRKEVFMEEQGFQQEFDERDEHCIHVTLYIDHVLAGCARIYPDEEHPTLQHIGRIALRPAYRGKGWGKVLVRACEAMFPEDTVFVLDAQCRLQRFYEALGYHVEGLMHMDEHVPHIQMRKGSKTSG